MRLRSSKNIVETTPDASPYFLRFEYKAVELTEPEWLRDWIQFQELASEWESKRNRLSSFAGDLMRDPAYLRIVGMGPKAVPFILWKLKDELRTGEPNQWFPALWAITHENPVPEQHRGKIREMAEAWLRWGIKEGHIRGEELGEALSQSR